MLKSSKIKLLIICSIIVAASVFPMEAQAKLVIDHLGQETEVSPSNPPSIIPDIKEKIDENIEDGEYQPEESGGIKEINVYIHEPFQAVNEQMDSILELFTNQIFDPEGKNNQTEDK